jgi:hypothetical protein
MNNQYQNIEYYYKDFPRQVNFHIMLTLFKMLTLRPSPHPARASCGHIILAEKRDSHFIPRFKYYGTSEKNPGS